MLVHLRERTRAAGPPCSVHVQGDGELSEFWNSPCGVCAQGDSVLTEFWNLVLLTTLYAMQGVPLGLTMGSM